jgi:hypothetical protein
MLKVDRKLVVWQANRGEILHAKRNAKTPQSRRDYHTPLGSWIGRFNWLNRLWNH